MTNNNCTASPVIDPGERCASRMPQTEAAALVNQWGCA